MAVVPLLVIVIAACPPPDHWLVHAKVDVAADAGRHAVAIRMSAINRDIAG
jgi:hypothetical protein